MSYSRGQIVEVEFKLPPDGELKKHPVVILSNGEINSIEGAFVAVMMTTNETDDEYSFVLDDTMFTVPNNDKIHREIRLHLIGNFIDDDVIKNSQPLRFLKEEHLKRVVTHINEITFDFKIKV